MSYLSSIPKYFINTFNSSNILVNIYEEESQYFLEFFLAGINKENISATFDSYSLSVCIKEQTEHKNIIKREYDIPFGERNFYFPDVDFSKSESNFSNGKLTISLPKTTFFVNKIEIK